MACIGNSTDTSHFIFLFGIKIKLFMFLFSRFFRFGVSHTPGIGRKRLLHLIATTPFLFIKDKSEFGLSDFSAGASPPPYSVCKYFVLLIIIFRATTQGRPYFNKYNRS